METPAQTNEILKFLAKPDSFCSPSSHQIDNLAQSQASLPLQSEPVHLSHAMSASKLSARWEIENNKLVCRWVISDRP